MSTATKETATPEEQSYVREIVVEEEIWTKAEREDEGNFLSIDDQMGNIKLNLTRPLELRDQEPTDYLIVRAPNTKEVQAFRAAQTGNAKSELRFFGGCCMGIKAEDVENLHSRDWDRLCRLVVNFTS